MKYSEIVVPSANETPEERLFRLELMYGVGATSSEWDALEFESEEAEAALKRSKTRAVDADALAKLGSLKQFDEQELDAAFPWPSSGQRPLNESEQFAFWIRCSRVAGRPLPSGPQGG